MPKRNKPDEEWDPVFISNYSTSLLRQSNWFETANELIASADALKPHTDKWWLRMKAWAQNSSLRYPENSFHLIAMMLYAFALEDLFKGVLIVRIPAEDYHAVKDDGRFPEMLKTHDLNDLAERAKFPATLEDEDLLARLARSAIWAARYPVAAGFEHLRPFTHSDGKQYNSTALAQNDLDRCRALVERVRTHVGALPSYRIAYEGLLNREDVEQRVNAAIETFASSESGLPSDLSERALTHRFAIHLEAQFEEWHVDCEYNRDGHDPKRLMIRVDSDIRSDELEARTVFPDIIVHERGTSRNLVVLEAKKSGVDRERKRDREKIRAFMRDLGYAHGILLTFAAEDGAVSLLPPEFVPKEDEVSSIKAL